MAVRQDDALTTLLRGGVLAALDEVPQGALVVGRERDVLWCNRAGVELLHQKGPEDVVGRPLREISRPTSLDDASWEKRWERLWAGEPWTGEIVTFRGDGGTGRLRVGRSPLRDEEGHVIAILSLAIDQTEELAAKEALVASEERLSALFRYSSDIAMVFTRSGRIVFVSPSVEHIAGWRPEDLIGKNGWDYLHPDDLARDMAEVAAALASGRPVRREWRMRRADGSYGWFEQTLTDLSHVPAIGGVIGNFRDVTGRHEADAARRESELILRHVVQDTSDGFVGIDKEGVITQWNPRAAAIFGWSADEAIGNGFADLIVPEHDRKSFMRAFDHVVRGNEAQLLQRPFEMVSQNRRGDLFPIEVSVVHVTVNDRSHFRAFIRDIAERKAAEERLTRQALTDSLTGLPNRTLLRDRLAGALGRLVRHPGVVAVLFLDLDRFKLVNDGLGHEAGDELLVAVAKRVREAVRETDTVARYGGDELVVVVEEAVSIDDAHLVAERILTGVSQPIDLAGRELRPRASIGIATTSDTTTRPDDLVRDADIAMYRAKERGGHCVVVFEPVMDTRAVVRFELDRDLRLAIGATRSEEPPSAACGKLQVHYQPIVSFEGRVSGLEALVRWDHPGYGLMSPLEFVPLAEETGLIVPLGEIVLETAVRQVAEWRSALGLDLTVAVNVAARQLDDPDFPGFVTAVLSNYGLDPVSLCLELTETTLLRDSGAVLTTLEQLSGLGVRVALDDFGTGYSSLAYLRRFPVDVVKLDRTFVSGVPESREDAAIVSAIIDLAHALGMQAVAEGIETETQREALRALGCELGQGYLWSPPRPEEAIASLLSRRPVLP
jgi:diguanylate cyclase (GGDEF)-like protein/PAS domain S-box-containing protein